MHTYAHTALPYTHMGKKRETLPDHRPPFLYLETLFFIDGFIPPT